MNRDKYSRKKQPKCQFSAHVDKDVLDWFKNEVMEMGFVYGGDKPAYGKFVTACFRGDVEIKLVEASEEEEM
ncbi:MAG: hypothetical protein AAGF93_00435 [Cyanobacteria bacterium P01_H01_bin.105]